MNVNGIKGCGSSALLIMWNEAQQTIFGLRWMIIFCLILIVVDFYYGSRESSMHYEEAKKNNDKAGMEHYRFHISRAGRRSFNKFVDYITYLLVGCLMGLAITEPIFGLSHIVTSSLGVAAGCLFDLFSIVGHVFVLHNVDTSQMNKKNALSFGLKLATNIVKKKSEDVGEALDDTINNFENSATNPQHFPQDFPQQLKKETK